MYLGAKKAIELGAEKIFFCGLEFAPDMDRLDSNCTVSEVVVDGDDYIKANQYIIQTLNK